jgi:Ser/Thr protein kinase RdoA (MazF antagonist)
MGCAVTCGAPDLVAAHWPALSAGALLPVLARYPGLGAFRAITWQSARPFAASGIVECDARRVFVKRHDPRVRTSCDLAEEHAFIGHLRAYGGAVPDVLTAHDGTTSVVADTGVYELHGLGEGEDLYRDAPSWTPVRNVAEAQALGRALARLHNAGALFQAATRQTRLVVAGDFVSREADFMAAIEHWVGCDADLRAALAGRAWRQDFRRVLLPWHDRLRRLVPALTPCWVHGDFHASNVLWQGGAVAAVLDFGLCNRASAVYDLATAIERNAVSWLKLSGDHRDIGHPELACAILDGYAGGATLPHAQVQAVRHVLPLVHVEFALSELSYFHAVTASAANAELAYSAFLLGHAAWFESRPGARLLGALG